MPFISRENLKYLLQDHCVELKFNRKHPTSVSKTRRMFCVGAYPNFSNNTFLASLSAQTALGFRLPKGPSPHHPVPFFNPDEKNLVITWDIFMMNYRCINISSCNVIRAFPVDTSDNIKNFWEYFNNNISPMTVSEKMDFHKK